MPKDQVYTAKMGQPPMDPEVAPPTSKADKKTLALMRANQLIDEAAAKKQRADSMGKMYIGSDEAAASHRKRQNMAEEDSEVLTERAKQYRKQAEGMAKGGSASARADGIAQRGKTRGTIVACGGGYMRGKK